MVTSHVVIVPLLADVSYEDWRETIQTEITKAQDTQLTLSTMQVVPFGRGAVVFLHFKDYDNG